jgi:shikimate dehydrogenase
MTQYIGVIGYPLKHTISPVFQQAALDSYRLDVRYQAWETENKDLFPTIERLKQPDYLGANITTPYKQEVLKMLDIVDDTARLLKAVNTVVNKEGMLAGYNTDVYGFLHALRKEARFEPKNKKAVILGSGGSARAICFGLIFEDIDSITIFNRTEERAKELAHELRDYLDSRKQHIRINSGPWHQVTEKGVFGDADLLVNCTTIGMRHSAYESLSPVTADVLPESILVYDLVYNPAQTPLLKSAMEAGAGVLNGLPMLVYQGAAAFELFLGKNPPVAEMFEAAKQALHNMDGNVN